MKIEDFYNKYGNHSHWKSLEGLDLDDIVQSNNHYSSHDQVIYNILNRLYMMDLSINKERIYYNNFDYDLNKSVPRKLQGHHEADLMCIMENKAYIFEVKSGNGHEGKAIKQLDADYCFITQNYPHISKVYKFYVVGHPNNYQIKLI